MALFPVGACFAQTKAPPADKPHPTSKSKPSAAKTKSPKKKPDSSQNGKSLHPEQERAYTQAYKTGAVRKP
jgi:hypothetical protein